MQQFHVTGMSCAACSARVEKAVNALDGVTSCSVSLLTNSMRVEGDASLESIEQAVEKAGYHAEPYDTAAQAQDVRSEHDLAASSAREEKNMLARLIASLVILAALMYLSMFGVMWGAPLPLWLRENPTVIALIELLLAAAVMIINQKFFISGTKGLLHGAPNMDTLVALGSAASFGYSTYLLLTMCTTAHAGDAHYLQHTLHSLYFESAAMILALITLGKLLETRAKGKTTSALKSLMDLSPKTAVVLRDQEEVRIPIAMVQPGDVFLVRPGESIPVDGTVLEGSAAVDQSALTGESIPVDKLPGDTVSAATMNRSGFLRCRADRVGQDTTISQIIRMVSEAAATKAPIAQMADRVSGVFVPIVLGIAVLTFLGWLTVGGQGVGYAIARGISVLVISCPCALGLATPVAIMVANGVGARRGILYKTAAALESSGRVRIVALDKTGTITTGEPHVTDLYPAPEVSEATLLQMAAAVEQYSEHPLSRAILKKCEEDGVSIPPVENFVALTGSGVRATLGQGTLLGGKREMVEEVLGQAIELSLLRVAEEYADQGKTPLYFVRDRQLIGMIAVADRVKEDSAQAIAAFKQMGIATVMVTGDHERTAAAIGRAVGVDEIVAGVLPQEKEAVIRRLQQRGKVAMIGDGINDAPALTRADTGIAIGAGTDVAIDAADVVLMNSSLRDAVTAIKLGRATLRNIRENLFWAFLYNTIGIPLAAGLFVGLLGWEMNPMFGAAAMSLSSFCVVTNALRLNRFREPNWAAIAAKTAPCSEVQPMPKKENIQNEQNKEEKTMEITLHVEGMMCPHCSGRVKQALEALEGVRSAQVSHENGTAIVTVDGGAIAQEVKKACAKAITDAGYTVVDA